MPLDGTWSFHPYLAAKVRSFDLEAAAPAARPGPGALHRAVASAVRALAALALMLR
jgi:hypothetical protein